MSKSITFCAGSTPIGLVFNTSLFPIYEDSACCQPAPCLGCFIREFEREILYEASTFRDASLGWQAYSPGRVSAAALYIVPV
jgi:hypothetical protein